MVFEELHVFGGEIFTGNAYQTDSGEVARHRGKVNGGATESLFPFAFGGLKRIIGYRTNNDHFNAHFCLRKFE